MKPLAVIGNVNIDLILGPAAPWPKAGTEIIVDHDELRVGGQAGNSALAWEGLGVDYEIAANVGSDQFGRWLSEAFGARSSKWPVRPEGTTLSVGITHPDGERTFFTTRGHLPRFNLGDVLAVLTVALDTGWPLDGWTDTNCNATRDWLARCGVALMNEVETTTLAGMDDPAEAARALHALMPQGAIFVVKRGPDGAIAIDADGNLVSAAAPRVTVVDTIGAGDVFNAGFLAALARGEPPAACLSAGTAVASRAISTLPRSYGPAQASEEAV
jgi:sugar/nucleoside kinase (ribokinase family)